MNIGIAKAQLLELEKQAETLERIVYNYLVELDYVPDADVERYEAKILRKLHRLDDIQDEIDMLTAKLKEAGAWKPVSHTGNVYQYSPPASKTPKPVQLKWKPKARLSKPKVTKPRKPKPKAVKQRKPKPDVKPRPTAEGRWNEVKPQPGELLTVTKVVNVLGVSRMYANSLVRRWAEEGKIKFSQMIGYDFGYCLTEDEHLYEMARIVEQMKPESVSIRSLSRSLGYTKETPRVKQAVDQLVAEGKAEILTIGSRTRYQLLHEKDSQLV